MPSRLTSNAARYAGQASRAFAAQALVAARSAASVGFAAAREAARITSYTEPTDVLTAEDAGDGTATIHVAAHKRIYPVQGSLKVLDVDVAAFAITGQPLATADLYVTYADLTLADTTPPFAVTADPVAAQVGNAPGLHLVGVVTTPAGGAPPTTGDGGAMPPGGGGGRGLP